MAEQGKPKGKKEEGDGEAAAPTSAPVKKGKTMLLVAGGVLGLLLLIGIPVAIISLKGGEKKEEVTADAAAQQAPTIEGAEAEDELVEGEEPLGAILPLEGFVLNLNGGRFLRLQLQIEFVEREVPKRIYPRLVPMRDALISLITEKKAEELLGEKGKDILRAELRDSINEMLKKEEVKRVYFTQFIIQ